MCSLRGCGIWSLGEDWLGVWRRTGAAVRGVVIRTKVGRGQGKRIAVEVHGFAGNLGVVFSRHSSGEMVVGGRDLESG